MSKWKEYLLLSLQLIIESERDDDSKRTEELQDLTVALWYDLTDEQISILTDHLIFPTYIEAAQFMIDLLKGGNTKKGVLCPHCGEFVTFEGYEFSCSDELETDVCPKCRGEFIVGVEHRFVCHPIDKNERVFT